MVQCSNCSANVSDEASSCPECGAIFVEETSTKTATGTPSDSVFDGLPIRSISIAMGGVALIALFLQLVAPMMFEIVPRRGMWIYLVFFVVWIAAVAGVVINTDRGYTVSASIFGLTAIWSVVAYMQGSSVGAGPLGRILIPFDPLSLAVGTISLFQLATQSASQLQYSSLQIVTIFGILLNSIISIGLWQSRDQSNQDSTSTADAAQKTTGDALDNLQYVSLLVLCGSVLFVVGVPMGGLIGAAETVSNRAVASAFPSLLMGVVVMIQLTQQTAGLTISTPMAVALGSAIPIALTIDLFYIRSHTAWNPNRLLYPLGALLLWFLTFPIYMYRRYRAIANIE